MRRTRRSNWKRLKALTLAFAAAALVPAVASAYVRDASNWEQEQASLSAMPQGYVHDVEQELAIIGGSTQTEIPYPSWGGGIGESRYEGVASPDGFQPQLRGGGDRTVELTNVDRRSFDFGDGALGFGLGLALAAAGALALAMSGRGIRMAHS